MEVLPLRYPPKSFKIKKQCLFSLDVEICKQFDKIVISGKKSRIVEELIKQFLESKKSPESLTFQEKLKSDKTGESVVS